MTAYSDFCALPPNDVTDAERIRLLMRLDDLLRVLGAPGDWGYDTQLGKLTLIARKAADTLRLRPSRNPNDLDRPMRVSGAAGGATP